MADLSNVIEEEEAAFDLALFEQLNAEYEQRPLVPTPPGVDEDYRSRQARYRVKVLSEWTDLKDKEVLEIGAAHGHLTASLVRNGGARRATGVDVFSSPSWEQFESKRIRLLRADLTREEPFPPGSVDTIVSNAVLEHVREPLAMIGAIARLLRMGGEAVLIYNLHRGPKASHCYREVFFPWPHLLFSAETCKEFYARHHEVDRTFAWVNRLTAGQYLDAFFEAGLQVEGYERSVTAIDLPLYLRFERRLGAYPALDLETDFFTVKLRKRRRAARRLAPLDYSGRQAQLTRDLAPLRGGS